MLGRSLLALAFFEDAVAAALGSERAPSGAEASGWVGAPRRPAHDIDLGVTVVGRELEEGSAEKECHNVEIGLIFDKYPEETRWEITQGRRSSIQNEGVTILKKSPFYDPEQDYAEASETHIVCLEAGRHTFTIMDRNGDGMCCNSGEGRYAVTYQETGEIIAHGSEFEQLESTTFQIPFVPPPLRDADGDGVEDRTGHVIPTMMDAEEYGCRSEFGLHLETDDYGVETTWELRERSSTGNYLDGKVVASGGPYTSNHTYDVAYCLRPGKYTFVFYDWQCDGLTGKELTGYYALKVNGAEVYRGGTVMERYWEEVKLEFTGVVRGEPTSDARASKRSFAACVQMMLVLAVLGWRYLH